MAVVAWWCYYPFTGDLFVSRSACVCCNHVFRLSTLCWTACRSASLYVWPPVPVYVPASPPACLVSSPTRMAAPISACLSACLSLPHTICSSACRSTLLSAHHLCECLPGCPPASRTAYAPARTTPVCQSHRLATCLSQLYSASSSTCLLSPPFSTSSLYSSISVYRPPALPVCLSLSHPWRSIRLSACISIPHTVTQSTRSPPVLLCPSLLRRPAPFTL